MSMIQWFSLIVAVLMIILSVMRIKSNPEKTFIRIPIIVLMLHVISFYIYVHLLDFGYAESGKILGIFHSGDWSSILRLHSLLTFMTIEIYGYVRDRQWKRLQLHQ